MSCVLTIPQSVPIYFAVEPVDMRRGHDGLAAIVRAQWDVDVFSGNLFVFLGRRLDRCKILYWDRGGFVLYYNQPSSHYTSFDSRRGSWFRPGDAWIAAARSPSRSPLCQRE